MAKKYCLGVLSDYEKLLELEEGHDTIIYVGQNQKEVRAHSIILRVRSQYFRTAFSSRWAERRNGKYILRKPNIDPNEFQTVLSFIYCGNIDFDGKQGPEVIKLMMASEELSVHQLTAHLKGFLDENKLEFLKDNPITMLEMIHRKSIFTSLWDDYLEIICEVPEILFSSENFSSLDEQLLKDLLECNAYRISEAKIWDSVLKWGLAKHPSFGQDITELSKDQFQELKVTLEDIIPLINFDYFDSTDVFHKVLPYKKLLSKDLVNNLLKKFLDKSNMIRCWHRTRYHKIGASTMITPHHYATIANWIEKREGSYKIHNNPYKFDLLYSKHFDRNMNLPIFHSVCNRIKETLIVAKIKDSDQLVGGYNPIGFRVQNSFRTSRNSFIFFFTDKGDVGSGKCSYVSRPEHAIYCSGNLEPAFGMGPDLLCKNNGTWTSKPLTYPSIDIPSSFEISHYEVFRITRITREI